MSESTYLLATRSTGKLRELRELLSAAGLRVIDLREAGIAEDPREDDIEVFETFEANAQAKAAYFHALSGMPTIADDSGLVVHALQGAPGVRSKRWSGRTDVSGGALDAANNAKLVSALGTLPPTVISTAEYVCAAAFRDARDDVVVVGRTTGTMTVEPRGTQGFGYDAYFVSSELGKTFGEATSAEKQAISHRGRAFASLLRALGIGAPFVRA